jgi:hypothetical protein
LGSASGHPQWCELGTQGGYAVIKIISGNRMLVSYSILLIDQGQESRSPAPSRRCLRPDHRRDSTVRARACARRVRIGASMIIPGFGQLYANAVVLGVIFVVAWTIPFWLTRSSSPGTRARSTRTAGATTSSAPSHTKILSKRLSGSRRCTRLGSRSPRGSSSCVCVPVRVRAACVLVLLTRSSFRRAGTAQGGARGSGQDRPEGLARACACPCACAPPAYWCC